MDAQDRIAKQIEFIAEIDKMKTIFRHTILIDQSRRENDAEHSWHTAMAAMLLYEHADADRVDLRRVIQMILVHDLVEIDAGDTFAYDEVGYRDKEEREKKAADRLFGMLPPQQGAYLRALWEEFDAMQTPDAQYAAAMDRLQPLINNYYTQGHTWHQDSVNSQMVYTRIAILQQAAPQVWELAHRMIQDSIAKGYLKP